MKLYVLVWQDRQIDVEVFVFSAREAAITWAKRIVEKEAADFEVIDDELLDSMIDDGWIYYCAYNEEDDNVRVIQLELDRIERICISTGLTELPELTKRD